MSLTDPDLADALDKMMRWNLEAWSSVWFWVLVGSTIAVAIGLLFEAPEVWHAVGFGRKTQARIRRFWYTRVSKVDWNGWETTCPELIEANERHRKWVVKAGFIGWTLVALGVAGEGVSEYFVNDAETDIRQYEHGALIAAHNSANSAAFAASLANTFAGKAQDKADAVAKRADDLLKKYIDAANALEQEKDKRLELAASLLDREFNQSDAVAKLSSFPSTTVVFKYPAEREPTKMAEQINSVVTAAPLNWSSWRWRDAEVLIRDGVTISAGSRYPPSASDPNTTTDEWRGIVERRTTTEGVAKAFVEIFIADGIDAQIGAPADLPIGTLLIEVGEKPNHALENAIKELAGHRKQAAPIGRVFMSGNRVTIREGPPPTNKPK
jgi:hypothetical protein